MTGSVLPLPKTKNNNDNKQSLRNCNTYTHYRQVGTSHLALNLECRQRQAAFFRANQLLTQTFALLFQKQRVLLNSPTTHKPLVKGDGGGVAQWLRRTVEFPCPAPDLWLRGDHFLGKLSAMCQPTWPTQPSIPSWSVTELQSR